MILVWRSIKYYRMYFEITTALSTLYNSMRRTMYNNNNICILHVRLPSGAVGIQCERARTFSGGIYSKHIHNIIRHVYTRTYSLYVIHILLYVAYIARIYRTASARVNDCEQTNFDDFTQSWTRVYFAVQINGKTHLGLKLSLQKDSLTLDRRRIVYTIRIPLLFIVLL